MKCSLCKIVIESEKKGYFKITRMLHSKVAHQVHPDLRCTYRAYLRKKGKIISWVAYTS